MPISLKIKPDAGLLYIYAEGAATAQQLADHLGAAASDPRFDPGHDILYDIAEDARIDLRDEGMEALVAQVQAIHQGRSDYRVACVVRSKEHETFCQAAMAMLSTGAETQVFYSYAEAFGWLGHAGASLPQLLSDARTS